MTKFEQLQNQTEASYPSAQVVAEIIRDVLKKLGAQSFRPEDGLADRVKAWEHMREPNRPETHTADGRPKIEVSAESQWLRPEQNQLDPDGVIRPRQQPVDWMQGFEWDKASTVMAGHFQRMRAPIFTEPADKSPEPGPGIPVAKGHKISW
jgi:hypothetical protein